VRIRSPQLGHSDFGRPFEKFEKAFDEFVAKRVKILPAR